MTKFYEEFLKLSKNEFPMLKFHSADYSFNQQTQQETLQVRFLISAFEMKNLTDSKKEQISNIVASMFPDLLTSVTYIKAYADENVVKNRLLEFLNSKNQILFNSITDDNLEIKVDDDNILIKFIFDPAMCIFVKNKEFLDSLQDFLDMNFVQENEIKVVESNDIPQGEPITFNLQNTTLELGLVKINPYEKVYSKRRAAGITEMPMYISKLTEPAESTVICGKVSDFLVREYKNKKYDPSNPDSKEPETKKFVTFSLYDTTGKAHCVVFPDEKDIPAIQLVQNGDEVVVKGKAQRNSMNPVKIDVSVDTICKCEIFYDSIKYSETKELPTDYLYVHPEKYNDTTLDVSNNLFEDPNLNQELPSNLKDKTYIVFDLETTGLSHEKDEIVEIGACKIENGKITETFQSLVKPTIPIPYGASEVNHITDDMVKYAPTIEKVLPDFLLFCGDYPVIGHNTDFDCTFISKFAKKLKYAFRNESIDTLTMSKDLLPNRKAYDLERLSKDFMISHLDAHRALSDVLATAELFKILSKIKDSKKK